MNRIAKWRSFRRDDHARCRVGTGEHLETYGGLGSELGAGLAVNLTTGPLITGDAQAIRIAIDRSE